MSEFYKHGYQPKEKDGVSGPSNPPASGSGDVAVMSDAPETIWVEDVKPEMGSICWRDNIFFVDATASASGVGCNGRLIEYRRADLPAPNLKDDPRVKALVELLKRLDRLGGLGSDTHERIRATLAALEPN